MPSRSRSSSAVRDALDVANPWLSALDGERANDLRADAHAPAFLAARRQASIERLAAGLDAWNDWAFQILKLQHDLRDDPPALALVAVVSTADLAGATFDSLTDLGSFQFPASAIFAKARFRRDVWFADAKFHGAADFSGAEFEGRAWFEFAKLSGQADFSDALFAKTAEFRNARFLGGATFARAIFLDAWFRGAEWRGNVTFASARFAGEAGLGDCRWDGTCDFSGVEFGDNAGFDTSAFADTVTFAGARFARHARFDGTTFAEPPVFDRARFASGPLPAEVVPAPAGSPVHQQIGEIRRRLGTR